MLSIFQPLNGRDLPACVRSGVTGCFLFLIAVGLVSGCAISPSEREPFDDVRDLSAELPVFPGAQGFGTTTPAGRGGAVHRVTSLSGEGPGSLRAALEAQGPRVVVFDVGGIIHLERAIVVTEPFLTIAGQTAPDPGITLVGSGIVVTAPDVLIQHVRTRPGDRPDGEKPENRDGISVVGRPDGSVLVRNVVIDRCSVSWAIDEGTSTWYRGVSDVTFSNNIIAENLSRSTHPKGEHSKGLLIGDHSRRVTILGNLFAHNMRRNPLLKGNTSTLVAGNIIYNPGSQAVGFSDPERSGPSRATVTGNLFIPGPDTRSKTELVWRGGETSPDILLHESGNAIFETDYVNYVPGDHTRAVITDEPPVRVTPLFVSPMDGLLAEVLSRAGARAAARDEVDARIVRSVLDRGGSIIDSQDDVGGYPGHAPGSRALVLPENPSGDDDADGYTNLDEWLHDLSAALEGMP